MLAVNVTQAKALRLISPNGGETFKAKQKRIVTWQSNGLPMNAKLKLSVSKNGVKWIPLATVRNTGFANWKPTKSQVGDSVQLRLCAPATSRLPNDLRCDETDDTLTVER